MTLIESVRTKGNQLYFYRSTFRLQIARTINASSALKLKNAYANYGRIDFCQQY